MDALSFVVLLRHSLVMFGVECDGRVEHVTTNYSLTTKRWAVGVHKVRDIMLRNPLNFKMGESTRAVDCVRSVVRTQKEGEKIKIEKEP
jgi:hypothetical protein